MLFRFYAAHPINVKTRDNFKDELFTIPGQSSILVRYPLFLDVYANYIPRDYNYLEPDDSCPRYIRDIRNNPNISGEYDKFVKGISTMKLSIFVLNCAVAYLEMEGSYSPSSLLA